MDLFRSDAMEALIRTRLMESSAEILTSAIILQTMNDGYKEVASRAFCIEHEDTVTTVMGSRLIPFDGCRVNKVIYGTNGLLRVLPTNMGYISTSGSVPQYWFQWGQYVVIEPVPDDTYSLTLFISDYPTLDTFTKVLLHFDGTDGSTTFTDESGKTWVTVSPAQIDTAQYKFSTASGLFADPGGDGDYIRTTHHTDFAVGTDNYTIDFWFKTTSSAAGTFFYQGKNDGASTTIGHVVSLEAGTGSVVWSPNYYSYPSHTWLKSAALNDGNWHHIACVRYGDIFTLYSDGNSAATVTLAGYSAIDSIYDISVGAMLDGIYNKYNGWIDELRFSNGIARWTENFTPPTSPYNNVTYPSSLPDEFHSCVVDFACYVLLLRLRKWGQAARFYNLYINNLKKRRNDYIKRKTDQRSLHSLPINK